MSTDEKQLDVLEQRSKLYNEIKGCSPGYPDYCNVSEYEQVEDVDKYIRALGDEKIQIIQSPNGTGKIHAIIEKITKSWKVLNILFLSARRSSSKEFVERLNSSGLNFISYLDNNDGSECSLYILQPEYLHLDINAERDIIIMDGITSILEQMQSPTNENNSIINRVVLENHIRCAKNIICLDTDIDRRSIEFLHHYCPDDEIHIQYNKTKPHIGNVAHFGDLNQMIMNIKGTLCDGKNVIVIVNDKFFGDDIAEKCNFNFFKRKYQFYHTQNVQMNDDLSTLWCELRILMYTSTVMIDADFISAHFHKLFIYTGDNRCISRNIMQQTIMIRVLIDHEIFVCSPEIICDDIPITYDSVKQYMIDGITSNDVNVKRTITRCIPNHIIVKKCQWDFKDDTTWSKLFFSYELEKYFNRSFMNLIIEDILKNQGYIIVNLPKEINVDKI